MRIVILFFVFAFSVYYNPNVVRVTVTLWHRKICVSLVVMQNCLLPRFFFLHWLLSEFKTNGSVICKFSLTHPKSNE